MRVGEVIESALVRVGVRNKQRIIGTRNKPSRESNYARVWRGRRLMMSALFNRPPGSDIRRK